MLRQWVTEKLTRQRLREFLAQHCTDEPVLDVGASSNTLLDMFPNAIRGDIRLVPANELVFDAHALPFTDASFPVVLCTEVLEHCTAPHTVLDEFYRVLKPGGRLILTTRFVFPLHDAPGDYFRYTKYGLRHLCRHFTDVVVTEEALTMETMGVLYQRLMFQISWKVPGTRVLMGLVGKGLIASQGLLRREYGDINHTNQEKAILASGYYVSAIKPL